MGNVCPVLFGQPSSGGKAANERSGLLANQHASTRQPASPGAPDSQAAARRPQRSETDPGGVPYTATSLPSNRTKSFGDDNGALIFGKIGLENLDKRMSDISALFNSLLERYSNLKTGLVQLEQIAKEICAKGRATNQSSASESGGDVIGRVFDCFARQMIQSADTEHPMSVRVKENAKNWIEAAFDSKSLQYDEISFLNLYNLLGRYAWELRSKTPPLRNTVAMTTQEEDTFRRDLLVASLNSEAKAFGANFALLRRVDERLGEFERLGSDAGERLAKAGRRLLD